MRKKILLLGTDNFGQTILHTYRDKGIHIVSKEELEEKKQNEYFKNEALKLSCFKENIEETKLLDKPKSKFHK